MAAPSLSAIGSMYLAKFSAEPSERPPEMMILAEVSSGRSFFAISSPLNVESCGSAAAATFSIGAEPPSAAAGKAEIRTVMTFLASVACTVWMALPA